jgi:hypothetical protein
MSILTRGEVPERLNGPVLKTGGRKSRGFESHPLRHAERLASALSVVVVLAVVTGCGLFARKVDFVFPPVGQIGALPVTVADETGLVVRAAAAPDNLEFRMDEGMATFENRPNDVALYWLGSACDERVDIKVSGSDHVTFAVAITRPGSCAGGVRRAIVIELSRQVDSSDRTVTFDQ